MLDRGIEARMYLERGTVVGEYEITGKLGEGAFGTVYSAFHPVIGKKAAIKVLKERAAESVEMSHRFKHEAQAVNAIDHPNIVDIFGYGALPDGRPYLIMELLRGKSLQELIAESGGRLDPTMLFPILRDVAAAVDAAHRSGVIHRDLKPENIFVTELSNGQTRVKVLDFGIAKMTTSSMVATQEGRPMGTPLFMAPEQCFGRPVDHRIDVYAFGVIAFYGLTGGYPVFADTVVAIVGQHMMGERVLPSRFGPEHARFDQPMAHCLGAEPDQRYPSLTAAYQALAAAHGEAILSGAPALPSRSGPSGAYPPMSSGPPSSGGYSAQMLPTGGAAASTLGRAAGAMGTMPREGTSGRSRAGVIGAVALLVAALAAVAVVVVVQASNQAPKSPEHADALDDIKRALVAEEWPRATSLARALLDTDPNDELARELFEQAGRESGNEQIYQLFAEATREDPPDAMNVATLYEAIPEDSVYRSKARPHYTKVRAAWLAPKAALAAELVGSRQCGDLAVLARQVDLVFPESTPRFDGLAKTCALADSASHDASVDDLFGPDEGETPEPAGGERAVAREDSAGDAVAAAAPALPPAMAPAPAPARAPDTAAARSDEVPKTAGKARPAKSRRKARKRASRSDGDDDPQSNPVAQVDRDVATRSDKGSGGDTAKESARAAEGAKADPAKSDAESSIPERLSRTDITDTMRGVRAEVMRCGQGHEGAGLVKVNVAVAGSGAPSSVAIDGATDTELRQCVSDAVAKARFPTTRDGGSFTYPFVF